MKKIFALVLLLVLMMGALVACNQVVPTEKKVRWENEETWTYNISLCDFSTSLTMTSGTYFRDFLYSGETSPLSGDVDRVAPDALSGQYVVTLSVDVVNDLTMVSTMQTMQATYPTTSFGAWEDFEELIIEQTDLSVTLQSVTETSVVFKNGTAQTPVSSYTKVNGFYIGRQYQSVTKYEISTQYEVKGQNTVAKVTQDGKTVEEEITGTNVIDNNQVLTFIRSYDKTSSGFQDNPQVMVFDPLTKTARKMTFAYTAAQNFLLDHQFADTTESVQVATTLNRLDVLLDGLAFMTQVNLPDMTEKGLDKISTDVMGAYIPKHTIYRFRVGFVSYQLTNYLTDDIVNAIQYKAE